MSTVSALTNAAGTIFALDVYRKLVRWQTDDRQLIMAGQMAAACSLACACLCAPLVEYFEGIFKYFQTGVTYVATPFISVLLLGILWRRANYEGALFGLIGGTMIMLGLGLGLPAMGWELHWLYVALIAQVIIMTGIVLVSLATPPPAEHQWAPFLWQPRLLSDYGDDKRRPWHQQARTWFAVYAILWCAIYWRFW
jgi:SSS family solute:Na+ symporter